MTRRMTLLVLAIVGLMVLVVTVTPPRTATDGGPEASPAPSNAVLSDPGDFDVTATLSADSDTQPQTIEAELGDQVEVIVEGSTPGAVTLGELRTGVYEADFPARLTLMAETPGAYPLVLVDDGRRIGTLEIR